MLTADKPLRRAPDSSKHKPNVEASGKYCYFPTANNVQSQTATITDSKQHLLANNIHLHTADNIHSQIAQNVHSRTADNIHSQTADNIRSHTLKVVPSHTANNIHTHTGSSIYSYTTDTQLTKIPRLHLTKLLSSSVLEAQAQRAAGGQHHMLTVYAP